MKCIPPPCIETKIRGDIYVYCYVHVRGFGPLHMCTWLVMHVLRVIAAHALFCQLLELTSLCVT